MPTVNGSLPEHIEMLRRHGVKIDDALELPECPLELEHVMDWFAELRAWSRQGMTGIHPLVWSDAGEWARAMRVRPTAAEWRMLQQLDTRFRAAAEKHKPKDKPKHPARR